MENTGNMFLMLAGIVQQDPQHDITFLYPHFWPVLTSWADYLVDSLPFPANQLCTGKAGKGRVGCATTES